MEEFGLENLNLVPNDFNVLGRSILTASGALERDASRTTYDNKIESMPGGQSAMLATLTCLGACLQGLASAKASAGAINSAHAPVGVPAARATIAELPDNHVHTRSTATSKKPPIAVRQRSAAVQLAQKVTTNDIIRERPAPEVKPKNTVGQATVPDKRSPQLHSGFGSPLVASARATAYSSVDPDPVRLMSGQEDLPLKTFLRKSRPSATGGRARSLVQIPSIDLGVKNVQPEPWLVPMTCSVIDGAEQVGRPPVWLASGTPPTVPLINARNETTRRQECGDTGAWLALHWDAEGHDQTPGGASGPMPGVVLVDGGFLGRWFSDCLARQVARPMGGTTGIDPRISAIHPGAASGL